MANIDTHLVHNELKALLKTSQSIKKLTWDVLEKIENDPSSFAELDDVPESLQEVTGLKLRKAKITNPKHDFRIIFAHWTIDADNEHVDLLLIFPRRDGYEIDWEWLEDQLVEDADEEY